VHVQHLANAILECVELFVEQKDGGEFVGWIARCVIGRGVFSEQHWELCGRLPEQPCLIPVEEEVYDCRSLAWCAVLAGESQESVFDFVPGFASALARSEQAGFCEQSDLFADAALFSEQPAGDFFGVDGGVVFGEQLHDLSLQGRQFTEGQQAGGCKVVDGAADRCGHLIWR